MCKISQLITGCSDSCPTLLRLLIYHLILFSRSPHRLPILQPRQGQLKEMIPHHCKIYGRFTPVCRPVYRIHWLPPWSCFRPRWFNKAGAHLLGVTGSMSPCSLSPLTGANREPNTGCIQFKPQSFSLAFWITLAVDTETLIMRWHVAVEKQAENWAQKLKTNLVSTVMTASFLEYSYLSRKKHSGKFWIVSYVVICLKKLGQFA